jgi:hypothetical protein
MGYLQVVLYVFAGTIVFVSIAFLVGQRRLGRHRGVSREDFIGAFAGTGVPTEIPAIVHDYYKKQAIFKQFSIAPDDSYDEVFRYQEEDIDGDARHLVKKLGLKLPGYPVLAQWDRPLKTLGDMVLWLDWVRQHQNVVLLNKDLTEDRPPI